MNSLNRTRLAEGKLNVEASAVSSLKPVRILQIGDGNFLRAFVDWMFNKLNTHGLFGGRVVVVQPIRDGLVEALNRQDGLYTLILRGLKDGKPHEQREIVSSISRGINPYTDWEECLKCAENPDIEFVVSNTTEAGIAYCGTDSLSDNPPSSYPGKLTAKNWAKRVKVSPDTAARDIKDLVEKGILIPQQGRVRDVFYGIQCNESIIVIPMPEDV